MIRYLKSRCAELLLCLVLSVSLASHINPGFVLAGPWEGNPPVLWLVHAALLALLFLAAYRRGTAVAGILCGAAAAVVGIVRLQSAQVYADEAGKSQTIVLLVALCTALAVFLLTRTRAGTAVLLLAGCCLMAGSAFLQFPVQAGYFVAFAVCGVLLFLHRFAVWALLHAQGGGLPPVRQLVQNAILCLLAAALACGAFFAVIRPLNPPTQELKLVTRLRSMELLQVLGVYTTQEIYDDTLSGGDEPEDEVETNDPGGEDEALPPEQEEAPQTNLPEESGAREWLQQLADAIRYPEKNDLWKWAVLALLVLCAAASPFVVRLLLRRRWLARTRAVPREEGIQRFYSYFLRCLGYTDLPRTDSMTLTEYAAKTKTAFEPFAAGEATFARLTEIYASALYGKNAVSAEEYALFEEFYSGFRRQLRKEIGWPRYLLHLFRI